MGETLQKTMFFEWPITLRGGLWKDGK